MKYFSKILFLILFSSSPAVWAVDDVIKITSNNPPSFVNVYNVGEIPIRQYIEGVDSAEIGPLENNTNAQAAFDAFTITTNTKLQSYLATHPNEAVIPNSTCFQVYDTDYTIGDVDLIDNAYINVGSTVVSYPGWVLQSCQSYVDNFPNCPGQQATCSSVAATDTEYSNKINFGFLSYTQDSEDEIGFYNPNLRESPDDETGVVVTGQQLVGGNGVGLIQNGIMFYSTAGRSASDIIFHYYHSMPPIAQSVSVFQGGDIEGDHPNGSHDSSTNIVGGTLVYGASWADLGSTRTLQTKDTRSDFSKPLQFEITFSEQVNLNNIAVSLISSNNSQGVNVGNSIVSFWGNNLGPNASPTYWFGEVEPSDLATLGAGPITVQISAVHNFVPGGLLDSQPQDVAFYFDGNSNYSLYNAGTYQPGFDTNNVLNKSPSIAFVQAVTVSQYSNPTPGAVPTPIYEAAWPISIPSTPAIITDTSSSSVTILADGPTVNLNAGANLGLPTQINIHFNKIMNTSVLPTVWAYFIDKKAYSLTGGSWRSDNQTYSITAPSNFITGQDAQTPVPFDSVTISISGAMDNSKPTNQVMDGDPRTIGYLDAANNPHGIEVQSDNYNIFNIAVPTPTSAPSPPPPPPPVPTIAQGVFMPQGTILDNLVAQLQNTADLESPIDMGADNEQNFYILGNGCAGWDGFSPCSKLGNVPGNLRFRGLWIVNETTGPRPVIDLVGIDMAHLAVGPSGMVALWNALGDGGQQQQFDNNQFGVPDFMVVFNPNSSGIFGPGNQPTFSDIWFGTNNVTPTQIAYQKPWFDYSGNLYAQGTDAKGNVVKMVNGQVSFSPPQPDAIYRSDVYGNNYILSDDANLYTLDAGGKTVNAFSTQLPPSSIAQDALNITADGRFLILDPSAGQLYQYSLGGKILSQSTVSSPDRSFKPSIVGVDKADNILLADSSLHLRVIQNAPLPPGFTPYPSPTFSFTFTPLPTGTNTPIDSPTDTPTITPTNLNGYTSTFTPTPTLTPVFLVCPYLNSWGVPAPEGVAVDSQGNVLVADNADGQVDVFNAYGAPQTQLGSGLLSQPFGLAVDGNGNIYTTNQGTNQVIVLNSQGNPVTQWNDYGGVSFNDPSGIAVNAAGTTVAVADQGNLMLDVFNAQGIPIIQWGGQGTNGNGVAFSSPVGVGLDQIGNVYVADSDTNLIQVYTSQGAWLRSWDVTQGTDLLSALFIAVDGINHEVYVSDGFGDTAVFDLEGNVIGSGQSLSDSQGIAVGNGFWYVTAYGGVIYQWGICSLNGVPVGTVVSTATMTPTPTLSPTITPSGDSFGSWLEPTDSAAFGQRSSGGALYFQNRYWIIGGIQFGTNLNDVWSSPDGLNWTKVTDVAAFSARSGFQTAVFNNKMWIIGGGNNGNDVWNSSDGIHWLEVTASAPWSVRNGFTCSVFSPSVGPQKGVTQMWIMGGRDQDFNVLNDVWSTVDGVNWNEATSQADFPGRVNHELLSYNNQLWVMGGQDFFENPLNDVWNSPDGVNWNEVTANAAWTPRAGFTLGVENNQMVLMGGTLDFNQLILDDVYHSTDGANWTLSSYAAVSPARINDMSINDGSRLWIFGGESTTKDLSDVWYLNSQQLPTLTPTSTPTPDGFSNWVQAVSDPGFIPRDNPGLAVFNNQLWMAGGVNADIGPVGDVWHSPDGVNWTLATDESPFEEQTNPVLLALNGKLWALNMIDYTTGEQAVYNSADGVNWREVSQSVPYTSPQQLFAFNGQLWVADATGSVGQGFTNQLYHSPDGINWTTQGGLSQENNFSDSQVNGAYTTYQGKMWILGGVNGQRNMNDIINSSDGLSWNLVASNLPFFFFNPRGYQAVSSVGEISLVSNGESTNQDEWASSDGVHWNQVISQLPFEPRSNFSAIAFNNQIWMIGGDLNGNNLNDIWTAPATGSLASTWTPTPLATDTPTWTPTPTPSPTGTLVLSPSDTPTDSPTGTLSPVLTPTPTLTPVPTPGPVSGQDWLSSGLGFSFTPRQGQSAVNFNGSLWVLGGTDPSGNLLGDIWNSTDGVKWDTSDVNAPFGARVGQAAVSFKGQLWVVGGQTSQGVTNDIWSSPDGVNWTQATARAIFAPRSGHQLLVFNNQMWLLGGDNQSDVWSSLDGSTWTQQANGPFQPSSNFVGLVFDNQIWVIGGTKVHAVNPAGFGTFISQSQVWSTEDGQTWNQAVTNGPFEYRTNFAGMAADGRMWIMGGDAASSGFKNDVWYSCDGINWEQAAGGAGFSQRQGLSSLFFNPSPGIGPGNMWVIGGFDQAGNNNGNSWSSALKGQDQPCFVPTPTLSPTPLPGLYAQWNLATANAGFAPRADQASVVFNNQMWVIGGGNDNQFFNDAWNTSTGSSWTQAISQAPFSPRINHGCAVFNNQIWVVGGQNFDGSLDGDVWSSPDGVTWTEAVTQAPFGPRAGLSLMVLNGQLWAIGGLDDNDDVLQDAWSSSDGVNWTQRASLPNSYTARAYQAGNILEGNFLLAGGVLENGSETADVWNSSDGVFWSQAQSNPGFPARQDASSGILDNLFFVIGGALSDGFVGNDVWYSPDGTTWKIATNSATFSARSDHSSVAFDNKLWVIAGWDGENYLNDVWSVNGMVPTVTPTITPNLTPVPQLVCPETGSFTVSNPVGLSFDANGNLAVGDFSQQRVDIVTSNGASVTTLGGPGTRAGNLLPAGIALDPVGKLFIADQNNYQVAVFDSLNHFAFSFGTSGAGQLNDPSGIAVDANGQVYVADTGNARVAVYNNAGHYLTQWTGFSQPIGVAVDSNGYIYVTDAGTETVQVFTNQGAPVKEWSTTYGLAGAEYIAIDNNGNLVYVSDGIGSVAVFDEAGDLLGVSQGAASGFNGPEGLAVGNGSWFVADMGNNRVEEFGICSLNGVPITSLVPTNTPSPTISPTPSNASPSNTFTPTLTLTPTDTPTETLTITPTSTQTFTITPTDSLTPTLTPSITDTQTWTPSPSATTTLTPTDTPSATFTITPTDSPTPTLTLTTTMTITLTQTPTATSTWTQSQTLTPTWTTTTTLTPTWTPSPTFTSTWTLSATLTPTITPTITLTPTTTWTASPTFTITRTFTPTLTMSPSPTPTWTATRVSTPTPSLTKTYTITATSTKTITPTPTRTLTPTATKTFTITPSPSFTPTQALVCTGSLTSPKLNLQIGCFQQDAQEERVHVRIMNWGSSPVTLSNLSLKMWVYESQLVNMQQWVQLGQIFQANGTGAVNVNNTGFTATGSSLSQPCTVDAAHMANQVIVFTPNGSTQVIPANGGYWDNGLDLAIGRNNTQMDDDWANDYSKPAACPESVTDDNHFTLYYNGALLQEWTSATAQDANTGAAPCCGSSGGNNDLVMAENLKIVAGGTLTPTPEIFATPTVRTGLLANVVAAPNLSDGQTPIRFLFTLGDGAKIKLSLFTITGEEVYKTEAQGQAGNNSLIWPLENQARQAVASGLYFYVLQVESRIVSLTRTGKIAVIR